MSSEVRTTASVNVPEEKSKGAIPRKRQDVLKWNGWGYKDSQFRVNEKDVIEFTGDRYPIGNHQLPYFTEWVKEVFNIYLKEEVTCQDVPTNFPEPIVSPDLLDAIGRHDIDYSLEGIDRLVRAHGHTLREIFILKHGNFQRIPDVVVWPKHHDDVIKIVKICAEYQAVCIPFGGGTSVSGAAWCPTNERRTIISLDTTQMNKILWIDKENLIACCQAGIIGQDLEWELRQQGLTSGHEPDSYEFSRPINLVTFTSNDSLGGWVATRASGMKKNTYGNIEDLVIGVRMVTGRTEDPEITLERGSLVPRSSCGPNFDHIILGSEGTLGCITEVILKVRSLPTIIKYGSIVFPNFQAGVSALRTIAKERCQPSSIRLMDNEQFKFGQTLRPESSWAGSLLQGLKNAYITRIKGFKWDRICVATLLFEGNTQAEVAAQEKKIYDIAKKYSGVPAGETNGERGYTLTFVIAYIRDLGLEYGVVSESFETSVTWSRTLSLCQNVKSRVAKECHVRNIHNFLISCRVTQTYDTGCCVYFYMAFTYIGLKDPVGAYEEIEEAAREEILANGGSLSHHHGVGKLRASFYPEAVGQAGVSLYRAAKAHLDPHNIFASRNLDPEYKSKL